ncbi:MAG: SRPBCC domain-containing protein [Gammaproteobacteria bacterium]
MTLVRRIAARPSIVFDALSTEEGMTSWWGPADYPVLAAKADVQVGGRFQVRFRTEDGLEHECAGVFLEISRPERIVMSWQWTSGGEPQEKENVSRIELHLRAIDTGTELTLIHAALRDEISARDHEWGWSGALDKLMRNFAKARIAQLC